MLHQQKRTGEVNIVRLIVRVEIYPACRWALRCVCATNGCDAIGGAEGIIENQSTGVILKERPRIPDLYPESSVGVFSSDLHQIIEVVDWLWYFRPIAPGQRSTGAGVENQANRARAGLMLARIRSQQVPVRN